MTACSWHVTRYGLISYVCLCSIVQVMCYALCVQFIEPNSIFLEEMLIDTLAAETLKSGTEWLK